RRGRAPPRDLRLLPCWHRRDLPAEQLRRVPPGARRPALAARARHRRRVHPHAAGPFMTVRRGLVWPLILIFVGVVFLLVNFGVIPPISAFALLSLWPLILVIIGIDIAVGRRWPLAALGANIAIVAACVALIAYGSVSPFGFAPFVAFGSQTPGESSID